MINVKKVAAGHRNVTLQIFGTGVHAEVVDTQERDLKLESLVWVIQEKMGVKISWAKDDLIMVMESRNSIRLDNGIPCPAKWDGKLILEPYNPPAADASYFIVLDFDR